MIQVTLLAGAILILGSLASPTWGAEPGAPAGLPEPGASVKSGQAMTLEQCLETALLNNRRQPVSRFAVAIAEAQHRQALAGYWPQVQAHGAYEVMDQAPNIVVPGANIFVPAQTLNTPPGTAMVTVPAGVLGPTAVQLPVSFPSQAVNVPAQQMHFPDQDIKLMDRDSFLSSVQMAWLVYDGGRRKGVREQTGGGLDAAREEARRTNLEIVDAVKRLYYGAVLARQIHQIGTNTLARMEMTLNLTETMFREGGGKVKKTDYLDNKIMVETLRAMVALLDKNEQMSQAALANTMGLAWDSNITPVAMEIPFEPYPVNLADLVNTAYTYNPDYGRLEAGLKSAQGAVRSARSGHYPKVALTGEVHRWWNDYSFGMATDRNKEGWTVGVGVELPLFDGFLTRNKVSETLARLGKMKEEQLLLKEGIGLQIRDIVLGLTAAARSQDATLQAMKAAEENRDLNSRAYENDLVETEKVLRAQLVEAIMSASHYRARYDYIALQSHLNLVVGTELLNRLHVAP